MDNLTDTQQKVYEFICSYIHQNGKSPLLPEIAHAIGIKSIGSLHKHVQALVEHKFIEIIPHRHRGIRLIERTDISNPQQHQIIAGKVISQFRNKVPDIEAIMEMLTNTQEQLRQLLQAKPDIAHPATSLPLLGKIAAGRPIEAIPHQQELDLASLFTGKALYALEVQGDSMIDAGILDGDKVICERCDTALDGEIVVALVDQESATLKRLKRNKDNTITLLPANTTMLPMTYSAERVQIQGKLLGLIRLTR